VPLSEVVDQAIRDWWEGEYKKMPFPFPRKLSDRFFAKSGAGHLTQMFALSLFIRVVYIMYYMVSVRLTSSRE